MRFTIRRKLLVGFLSVLVLMFAVGGVSIWKLTTMEHEATNINNSAMPSLIALGDIQANYINSQRLVLRFVLETDKSEKDRLEAKINTILANEKKSEELYISLLSDSEEHKLFESFMKKESEYKDKIPDLLKAGQANEFQKANQIAGEMRTPFNDALDILVKSIDLNAKKSEASANDSVRHSESGKMFVTVMVILSVLMGIGVTVIISRIISGPVKVVAQAAGRIAAGDLTFTEIKVKNRDEIGDLAHSFTEMARNLHTVISQVGTDAEQVAASAEELTASAEQVSQATEQIASTMQGVAAGSQKQVESVTENTIVMQDLSFSAKQIASNAQSVSSTAAQASEIASEGNQAIRTAIDQIGSIQRTVNGLAQTVQGLGDRSQEIGKIVEVISDIAAQTNLLALNAAIEAARAGEDGRGFAVVAQEVRKLSEQSAQSTQQIAQLIAKIQAEAIEAVQSMETSVKEVAAGMDVIHTAGHSFERIHHSVNTVASQIQEVAAAAQQMSAGTEEAVHSIHVISDVAETASSETQNVSAAAEEQLASMEEIASSAAALNRMSEELQSLIGKFKI